MKSPRQFWEQTVLEALRSTPDEALERAADIYIRRPGAKFILEIIHHTNVPLGPGEITHKARPHIYLEVEADKIKETIQ